jgi:hypothetical protein
MRLIHGLLARATMPNCSTMLTYLRSRDRARLTLLFLTGAAVNALL